MIEPRALEYGDFDEETGFGEPVDRTPANHRARLFGAVVAVGVAFLLLTSTGAALSGSWAGLLLTYVPLVVGALGVFVATYGGTHAGIKHDGAKFSAATARGWIGWGLALLLTSFYVVLYFRDELRPYIGTPLDGAVTTLDPLCRAITGEAATRWFLYGWLYTLAVLVFGARMFWRYRHNRYELIRTASVMFFQLGFAFLIPHFLRAFDEPEYYMTYFWPLKPEYLYPHTIDYYVEQPGALGMFLVVWSTAMTFVAVPVLTYFFGKRWYCSWVCGCGGLAETLGDPWRHLSNKSTGAWKLERWLIHSVLVAIVVLTVLLWTWPGAFTETYRKVYAIVIVSLFAGVAGVGFYPLLGSRVWCRFGCPLAAILGLFQRYFSRFRITTNGSQCMSCGNCSTYCEMGIDVRAYAQRGANIVRASGVGCGVCSAVCPRGVLKLENGIVGDRFEGADRPLDRFLEDLREEPKAWK